MQADGNILVGGDFSGANSIGGATRHAIARLNSITGLVDWFNPNLEANAEVFGKRSRSSRFEGRKTEMKNFRTEFFLLLTARA